MRTNWQVPSLSHSMKPGQQEKTLQYTQATSRHYLDVLVGSKSF